MRLIQFLCLVNDAILQASCQHVTSRTNKMFTGNIRTAYMREYRKRKRLEEDNCNNVPKRTKLHAERQRKYTYREAHNNLSAEYMHNYRKGKAQENKTPQASTSTDPTPTPIIYCNVDGQSGVFTVPCRADQTRATPGRTAACPLLHKSRK
jgi:hypothetical protein